MSHHVHSQVLVQQGGIPGVFRVSDEDAYYVLEQTWEGSRLLNTRALYRSRDPEEARAKAEEIRQSRE